MDAGGSNRVEIILQSPLEGVEASIMDAVRQHLGCRIDELVAIPTYTNTIVYAVQTPGAALIFKAADPRGRDPSRIALEAWACERAISAGLPAPPILAVDTTAALFPAPYLLMARVAGQPLDSLGLTIEQQKPYLRQAGRLLRLLHAIRLDGYGTLDDGAYLRSGRVRGEAETWRAAVTTGMEDGLSYLARHHLLGSSVADTIEHLMIGYDTLLTAWTDSRLLHGDLGANHIFVDPIGERVTGLIDFGSRWAGDPAWDIAAYEWAGGRSMDYLLEGYAPDHAAGQTLALKAALYSVYQAVPWARWCHERGYTHATDVLTRVVARAQERLRQF